MPELGGGVDDGVDLGVGGGVFPAGGCGGDEKGRRPTSIGRDDLCRVALLLLMITNRPRLRAIDSMMKVSSLWSIFVCRLLVL